MSFLSIAFLSALPLAAVPILLHLFDRRRNVVIQWGAMQFLLEAATRKTKPRRVQHWLLLVLRVSAISALVLALARPLISGTWFAARQHEEVILVLDNSMSTLRTATDEAAGKTLFDRLLARAEKLLDELAMGDSVRILTSSPYPVWVTPASVRVSINSRAELHQRLRELRPTLAASDLLSALSKAVQLELEDNALQARRIVLLTDGQRTDWRTDDAQGWAHFRNRLESTPVPTSVEVSEVTASEVTNSEAPNENLAVKAIRLNHAVVGVDQSFTVRAVVQNLSASPAKPCSAHWTAGNVLLDEASLPGLGPGETHEVVQRHSFRRPGVYTLAYHADAADALQADNSASVVVEVVERIPILVIETSEGLAEMQQDAYLVRAALGRAAGDEATDWRSVFVPHEIAPPQLETIRLEEYRVVVIPNLTTLSRRAVERLTEYVRAGGGLWMALGPRTDIREFNRQFFQDGDGLSPVPIERAVDKPLDDSRQPTINPFLKDHPATIDLAGEEQLDLGDIKVHGRFQFRMPAAANEVPVLLDLTTGDPLVVEHQMGLGRVIVQAIPLRWQWSTLATSQAFVVMVHNWLSYLSEPLATRHNLRPGDPISIHIAKSKHANGTLTTPDGEDIAVTGEPVGDSVVFRTSRTSSPGNYLLDVGLSGDAIPFVVTRGAAESELSGLNESDRTRLREIAGLHGGRITGTLSGTNRQDPIWPALLLLLTALLAIELMLSGRIARQRFGNDPISETMEPTSADNSLSWSRPETPFTARDNLNGETSGRHHESGVVS